MSNFEKEGERETESTKRRERRSDKLPQRYRKEVPEEKRVPNYSGNPLFFWELFFRSLVTPIEKAAKERKINSKEQRKQEHAKDKKAEKEERRESSKSKKQQKHAQTEKKHGKGNKTIRETKNNTSQI